MSKSIINLTQHVASVEQKSAGVVDPEDFDEVREILTFRSLPTQTEIKARAGALAEIAVESNCDSAMIDGVLYLMPALLQALRERGVTPLFAFSERESVEQVQPDGSVRKTAVFRHKGFVEG